MLAVQIGLLLIAALFCETYLNKYNKLCFVVFCERWLWFCGCEAKLSIWRAALAHENLLYIQ